MASFTVDPATLHELSSTLSGIHSEMNAMHGVATGFEGLLGGGGLDGEVEGFSSHWGYGLRQMSDQMGKVVAKLDAAAKSYSGSDQQIGTACAQER